MIINSVTKYKGTTYEVVIDGEKIYLHRDIVADFACRAAGTDDLVKSKLRNNTN